MKISSQRGQITVFLCFILVAILIFSGVLVDGSRVAAARAQTRRAVSASAESALSLFDSKLKDDYGIFCLNRNDQNELQEIISEYLKKNLMIDENPGQKGFDPYNFRIESLNVSPLYNLTENDVVKNQILQYMKYRAPKAIIEGILDRLAIVKDGSNMAEAYKRKSKIDKLASKVAKLQEKLKKLVNGKNGDGKNIKTFVDGFNLNGVWNSLTEKYASLADQYKSLVQAKSEIDQSIQSASFQLDNDSDGSQLAELMKQSGQISAQISAVYEDIKNTYTELKIDQTDSFIAPNNSSIDCIQEILKLKDDLTAQINDLKDYLGKTFGSSNGTESGGFGELLGKDLKDIEDALFPEGEDIKLIDGLKANCGVLKNAVSKLDLISADSVGSGSVNGSYIRQVLDGIVSDYKGITYDYKNAGPGNNQEDTREQQAEAAKKRLNEPKNEDKELGENEAQLPSHKKIASRVFSDQEDGETGSEGIGDNSGPSDETPEAETKYEGDIGNLGDEVGFDEDSGFSEDALGFLGSFGDLLGKGISQLMDNLYINEYIMGTFKNAVPYILRDGQQEKDLNLRGLAKTENKSYFDYETEYILNGAKSQNTNKTIVEGEILLIRFAMDTLHVYMDPQKKQLALGIAAAVAGWWTGGLGIPIVSNLIMCGWGMGEAIIDLNHLMKGELVPFYKLKGDWELNLGLVKASSPKTENKLKFSYYDYLRLFLLFTSTENKINRIEDLIQLNRQLETPGFMMGNCNTMLRVDAVISMKYNLLTGLFSPKSSKTSDGRHKFRVVLYDGYK
ncbi:MAG: DUF5702 domain-containing protein [Bacillota bacterium]|nr:DUF5702 domain-containing protein [Bacillota bacterium]